MNTKDIEKLLELLSDGNDQSKDCLKFISSDLKGHENELHTLGIKFEGTAEGVSIDLSDQKIHIYKSTEDCIKFFNADQVNKHILIIEGKLFYNGSVDNVFFENLIFSKKIKKLLADKGVVSYNDKLNKLYVFLSEKNGRIDVGYEKEPLNFYTQKHDLEKLYKSLQDDLTEEYITIFRDNVIKTVEEEMDVGSRFIFLLSKLKLIVEKTKREYSLFINKFSFDEFNSKLEEERDKYFKSLQEYLTDFLSKVNSLPIQIGVYIYLIFRYEKELFPLIIASLIIVIWSIFSCLSMLTLRKGVNALEDRLQHVFKEIVQKSGIDKEFIDKEKQTVTDRIKTMSCLTAWYIGVVIVFSLCFIALASYSLCQ